MTNINSSMLLKNPYIYKPSFPCFQIFVISHVWRWHQSVLSSQIYPHCFIDKILFKNANDELGKIPKWFKATKFSLNEEKTNLFPKPPDKVNLPLQLPKLKINNYKIKRSSLVKFLDILVDEGLTWVDHITTVENKHSKNLGLFKWSKKLYN